MNCSYKSIYVNLYKKKKKFASTIKLAIDLKIIENFLFFLVVFQAGPPNK